MLVAACLVLLVSPIVRAEDSAPVMLTDGQLTALRATDTERSWDKGLGQFLDDKSYRPGLGEFRRDG